MYDFKILIIIIIPRQFKLVVEAIKKADLAGSMNNTIISNATYDFFNHSMAVENKFSHPYITAQWKVFSTVLELLGCD